MPTKYKTKTLEDSLIVSPKENEVQVVKTCKTDRRGFLNYVARGTASIGLGGLLLASGCSKELPPLSPQLQQKAVEQEANDLEGWTKRADMPTARSNFGAAFIDGILYIVGGQTADDKKYLTTLKELEAYDPVIDKWTEKGPLDIHRSMLDAVAIDGKLYAVGGCYSMGRGYSSFLEVYDPKKDKWPEVFIQREKRGDPSILENIGDMPSAWERKRDMPTPRMLLSVGVIDGKLYVIGGWNTGSGQGHPLSTLEVYDPKTDTWERKRDMPTPRLQAGVGALENKLYVIGGYIGKKSPPVEEFSPVEVYDPKTDTWECKASIKGERSIIKVVNFKDKLYIVSRFGGIEMYDSKTDKWAKVAELSKGTKPRQMIATCSFGDRLYIYSIGGGIRLDDDSRGMPQWEFSNTMNVYVFEEKREREVPK